MAKVNLKHSGAVIDQQIDRVLDGSVVVDNTLSALDETSDKPVSGKGIASAIEAASNNLKERGYIYMGVATPTMTPDVSAGKVFYLAAKAGEYPNFEIVLPTDALTSFEWDGKRWYVTRIIDLVTPAEVEQAILDNTAKKIEKGEAKPVASEVVAEALEARDEKLENKADKTEYYPEMAVGVADNLRGRGEAKEEIYTYRPSAGSRDSITDEGIATVKRLKGNTIVWNQLFDDPKCEGKFSIVGIDEGMVNGYRRISGTKFQKVVGSPKIQLGHWYLITVSIRTDATDVTFIYNGALTQKTMPTKEEYAFILKGRASSIAVPSISIADGTYIEVRNWMFFDLTKMFGAGNEPTTVEEFYERIPMGIDPYAYNEGELLSVNVESIVTNGFNQFNGEYAEVLPHNTYYLGGEYTSIGFAEELGGTTEEIVLAEDRLYTPATKGYIYASGANININLSHSGVRDGEYEPYEERVHKMSEIAQYFPDGMRSAGAVYDEIESEVIQRVGVVDLGSLEWGQHSTIANTFVADINELFTENAPTKVSNLLCNKYEVVSRYAQTYESTDKTISANQAGVYNRVFVIDSSYTDAASFKSAMSGVMLYYELARPIVTSLLTRAINRNYAVWDWGTEKAVSSKLSAPFRADIVYGFNAVDTIRTNKLDIEALMLRVAELEAKIAETNVTTIEEEIL